MNADPNRRSPWTALSLSLLCTGLGHVYCGRAGRGLTLFLLTLLSGPVAFTIAGMEPSRSLLICLLASGLGVLALYLFAALDALRLAASLGPGFELRDYNRGSLYALFVLIGLALPTAGAKAIQSHVFAAYHMAASSMVPTLLDGDQIMVNKRAYPNGAAPRRGELIAFREPGNRGQTLVKRVLGLPGDRVEVRDGKVWINQQPVPQSPLSQEAPPQVSRDLLPFLCVEGTDTPYGVIARPGVEPPFTLDRVPDDTCFVLGDFRSNSMDSRVFGCVPLGDLVGRVDYVQWPVRWWERFGVCDGPWPAPPGSWER